MANKEQDYVPQAKPADEATNHAKNLFDFIPQD